MEAHGHDDEEEMYDVVEVVDADGGGDCKGGGLHSSPVSGRAGGPGVGAPGRTSRGTRRTRDRWWTSNSTRGGLRRSGGRWRASE